MLVALTFAGSQLAGLAVASVSTTVACCCGEHDAADDCGCLDCPAAVAQAERKSELPVTPAWRSCESKTSIAGLVQLNEVPPAGGASEVATAAQRRSVPERAAPPPPSPTVAPPVPPG